MAAPDREVEFARLYRLMCPRVGRLALRVCDGCNLHPSAWADDLCQIGMTGVWVEMDTFDQSRGVAEVTYFTTVARSRMLSAVRAIRGRTPADPRRAEPAVVTGAVPAPAFRNDRRDFLDALGGLISRDDVEYLWRRFGLGMTRAAASGVDRNRAHRREMELLGGLRSHRAVLV